MKDVDEIEILSFDDEVNVDVFKTSILNDVLLTTKENSIITNFDVDNGKCKITSTKIEQSGKRDLLHEAVFDFDKEFKENILETVIFDYSLKDPIVIKEIGDSDTLGKVNFRLVTENNDLLVVVGIDQEYANKLSDIVSTISNKENNLVYVKKNDEHGISNTLIIILTIILIAILLAGVIFFMMANR